MSRWNLQGDRTHAHFTGATANSFVGIASSATNHTKGSWVEVVAACPVEAVGFWVYVGAIDGGAARKMMFDIGVGAAASEQVIVANIPAQIGGSGANPNDVVGWVYFPLSIPAGARVAARSQCENAGDAAKNVYITMSFVAGGFGHPSTLGRATTYGADSSFTEGVEVDPGGTINTKGAWTEVSASLTNPVRHLTLFQLNQAATRTGQVIWAVDVGIGAAASEVVVISNWSMLGIVDKLQWVQQFPISIPAGVRLAVRASCDSNNATHRKFTTVAIACD